MPRRVLYTAFDIVPSPKGASTHILHSIRGLVNSRGRQVLFDEGPTGWPHPDWILPRGDPSPFSQIKKSIALSVSFFLILGISATTLIWVNQNRHLRKMEELEDRIRLAERLSSLGHLAAGVAHEIRNPLNAMGMGLQRLKREFLPQEESKREEYLSFADLILKEVRRVNEIIEQFLTLSRPFDIKRQEGSPGELLKHLVILFQEEANSQGITLRLELGSDLRSLSMDEEKLTQAFIN